MNSQNAIIAYIKEQLNMAKWKNECLKFWNEVQRIDKEIFSLKTSTLEVRADWWERLNKSYEDLNARSPVSNRPFKVSKSNDPLVIGQGYLDLASEILFNKYKPANGQKIAETYQTASLRNQDAGQSTSSATSCNSLEERAVNQELNRPAVSQAPMPLSFFNPDTVHSTENASLKLNRESQVVYPMTPADRLQWIAGQLLENICNASPDPKRKRKNPGQKKNFDSAKARYLRTFISGLQYSAVLTPAQINIKIIVLQIIVRKRQWLNLLNKILRAPKSVKELGRLLKMYRKDLDLTNPSSTPASHCKI